MTEATMDDVRAVLDAVLGSYLRAPSKLLAKAQRDHEQFLKEIANRRKNLGESFEPTAKRQVP